MRILPFLLATSLTWAACVPDGRGVVITGLSTIQDWLLGPLTCQGTSPWVYGDLAETGTADNMAPLAIAQAPALSTALSGTISWTQGTQVLNTTSDLRTPLAGQSWIVVTWTTVDGAGTGRMLKPVGVVTASTISVNGDGDIGEPTTSGATAYLLPPAVTLGGNLIDFQQWTVESPSQSWNYYDVAVGLYRLHHRVGSADTTYLGYARQYADIQWQWVIDHGYRFVFPRAASMVSQFFRALDGHSERFPGLYNWINDRVGRFASVASAPNNFDGRESGYWLWDVAMGARTDPDATRHAQYCSLLATYTSQWNNVQGADGSFGENAYSLNHGYVTAPKTFSAPFIFVTAPWRLSISIKALEAAYDALSDTSSTTGCNQPAIAATTLTAITNAITWQRNYGRDSVNRGAHYGVNGQSSEQQTVAGAGTVSINLGSTALAGIGTNWNTAGMCDGTHFVGIGATGTVYKIASCASNTAATLSVAFGLYGSSYNETSNVSGSAIDFAPAAGTTCNSSATYCFDNPPNVGDRNLTRVQCGAIAWLYAKTLNSTYLNWSDECVSASNGGPTAGLTSATVMGNFVTPCSGAACDGFVDDSVASALTCGSVPCIFSSYPYTNLGKNYGEKSGAPGIENALAWRLWAVTATSGTTISGNSKISGGTIQ